MSSGRRRRTMRCTVGTVPAAPCEGATAMMKRFMIERHVPGASTLTPEQLAEISRTSNEAVASLGVPYTWVTTYVVGDALVCVHETEHEDAIREHARRGGFRCDQLTEIVAEFGPQTATSAAS